MDFFELIEKRRSIRRYKNEKVEPEKIEKIVEAALRAPSSRGRQPWEFVVVTKEEIIGKLSQAKERGIAFLAEAPLALVICADAEDCDVWIEDASIASTFVFLAAEALGLGCCWIQIRARKQSSGKPSEEFVREVLEIPANFGVAAILAIGYPDEVKPGHSRGDLPLEKVFLNRRGKQFH